MSFLVDPTTLRSLHCPECKAMYNTGENAPCLNDACGHTLCGRCFLLKGDQNCGVENCATKIRRTTQEFLPFFHNRLLVSLMNELAQQRKVAPLHASSAGSLSAPSANSAAPSAPPPAYGSFSPAPVPPPLYSFPAAEANGPRFARDGEYNAFSGPAVGASSQFSIPDPDPSTGLSQRKFLADTSTEVAEEALKGQARGHFLACHTSQSLQNRRQVQAGGDCQIFRLNYVDLQKNLGEVLVRVSWVPNSASGSDGYTITIEVEKARGHFLTERYKVSGHLEDIPFDCAPHHAFLAGGFPQYLQEGGTFWRVHFPRLYKKILGIH